MLYNDNYDTSVNLVQQDTDDSMLLHCRPNNLAVSDDYTEFGVISML